VTELPPELLLVLLDELLAAELVLLLPLALAVETAPDKAELTGSMVKPLPLPPYLLKV
jgi:hypothetical protein